MPRASSSRTNAANSGSATPRLKIRSVSRPPSVTKRPPDSCGRAMTAPDSHRSSAHDKLGVRTQPLAVVATADDEVTQRLHHIECPAESPRPHNGGQALDVEVRRRAPVETEVRACRFVLPLAAQAADADRRVSALRAVRD